MTCNHTTAEHDQALEDTFQQFVKIHQSPGSPLTSILATLDLTWDDLPTLQAEEVIAIFESTILAILSLTAQDKEEAEYFSSKGIYMAEKANTLRALRKALDEAGE